MDFNDLPVMQMMTRKMSWLTRRTDLLAENVADVDMPGYNARDLKQVSFRDAVKSRQVAADHAPVVTNVSHLAGTVPVLPPRWDIPLSPTPPWNRMQT